MINQLNKIISKFKGEKFEIDNDIPLIYLFSFISRKIASMFYGIYVFRSFKKVFVDPTSKVKCASKIKFGKNFSIARNCYIDALSKNGLIIGDNVSMGIYTTIDLTGSLKKIGKGTVIGNNVGLGSHGFFGSGLGGLEIGNDTIIGNYVSFHPENHNFSDLTIPIRLQGVYGNGVKIGENCWIGAKVTFLDGADIGNGCVVAAGAVVRGKFPDNSIIGGVPAKILKIRT